MSYKEIIEIEDKIAKIIQKEGNTVHFKKDWIESSQGRIGELVNGNFEFKQKALVSAFTYNSNTKETFLLKEVAADNHLECMQIILEYLEHTKESMNSFTVNWSKKENGRLGSYNTSFFYCHNILEVMDKFFAEKSVNDYVIHNVKLNPLS
jgi:hypothetical protein